MLLFYNYVIFNTFDSDNFVFNSMKVGSKRRRTKQEIEDEKLAALAKEAAIQDKLATIDRL